MATPSQSFRGKSDQSRLPAAIEPETVISSDAPFKERAQEALHLWLRWNNAYERVTVAMTKPGGSQRQIEELMDQMDVLRRRAIELSQEIVDS